MGCLFKRRQIWVVSLTSCIYQVVGTIFGCTKRDTFHMRIEIFEILSNIARNPCDSIKLRVGRLGSPWLEHDFKLATWTKLSVCNNL